jgi:Kef-type K+ transport system membrane component KefB
MVLMTTEILISLILILVVAWGFGYLFNRYGLPVMLGELLAGILLGPPILGIIGFSPSLELIAEFGIFFVMFYTGLEMDPEELLNHLGLSLMVAIGGFILPYALGFLTAYLFGATWMQALFIGLGISITAIAVNSVILQSMEMHKTALGAIIIGAAIADDILSLLSLSVLLGLAKSATVNFGEVMIVLFKVVAFFALAILVGRFLVPYVTKRLHDEAGRAFTFGVLAALVMGYLAELAGLHLIIGAFVAGQFVRKDIIDKRLYNSLSDRFYGLCYGFLVPVFFASLSFHLRFFWEWSFLLFTVILIAVAIVGKVAGCGLSLAVYRRNFWESAIVGFGMNGRGAVELVIASVVVNLSNQLMSAGTVTEPLLTETQFSALVFMAFVTTFITPILLRWAALKACLPEERSDFCELWKIRQRSPQVDDT